MDDDEGRQAWSRARGRGGAAARRGRRAQASADGSGRAARLRGAPAGEGARGRSARAAALTMDIEGVLAIVFIFGGGFLFLLAISPIGKAIAERIRGGAPNAPGAVRDELERLREDLLGELQQLRKDVNELGERVDFAERMLAQHREAERLPPVR